MTYKQDQYSRLRTNTLSFNKIRIENRKSSQEEKTYKEVTMTYEWRIGNRDMPSEVKTREFLPKNCA